jgi:hypothetical protein
VILGEDHFQPIVQRVFLVFDLRCGNGGRTRTNDKTTQQKENGQGEQLSPRGTWIHKDVSRENNAKFRLLS